MYSPCCRTDKQPRLTIFQNVLFLSFLRPNFSTQFWPHKMLAFPLASRIYLSFSDFSIFYSTFRNNLTGLLKVNHILYTYVILVVGIMMRNDNVQCSMFDAWKIHIEGLETSSPFDFEILLAFLCFVFYYVCYMLVLVVVVFVVDLF